MLEEPQFSSRPHTWLWLKIKELGLRKFQSLVPFTKVPCWYIYLTHSHMLPSSCPGWRSAAWPAPCGHCPPQPPADPTSRVDPLSWSRETNQSHNKSEPERHILPYVVFLLETSTTKPFWVSSTQIISCADRKRRRSYGLG